MNLFIHSSKSKKQQTSIQQVQSINRQIICCVKRQATPIHQELEHLNTKTVKSKSADCTTALSITSGKDVKCKCSHMRENTV